MAWHGDFDELYIKLEDYFGDKPRLQQLLQVEGRTEALLNDWSELTGKLTLGCDNFISAVHHAAGKTLSQPALRAWVCGRTACTTRAAQCHAEHPCFTHGAPRMLLHFTLKPFLLCRVCPAGMGAPAAAPDGQSDGSILATMPGEAC